MASAEPKPEPEPRVPAQLTPPRVRAPLTKSILAEVDDLPETQREAVYDAVPETVAEIRDAARMAWIQLPTQLALVQATRTVLGSDAAYENFCAKQLGKSVAIPLVRPIFQAALRLFGAQPSAVLGLFSRTWSMLTVNVATITIPKVVDSEGTVIRVAGIPKIKHADALVVGFAGTFRGILELFDRPGSVELVDFDPSTGDAAYLMRWE